MTIKQWHDKFGGEHLIGAEGRGTAGLVDVGDGKFMVVLTDMDMEVADPKWGETKDQFGTRREQEAKQSTFPGEQDVMAAVNYFLDKVAYSDADREEILRHWQAAIGQ